MQSTPRQRLLQYAHVLQGTLFGILEAETGILSERAQLLIAVLEMIPLSRQLPCARGWMGRPAKDRHALAAAFLAKAVYGLDTTRQLLQRLHTDRQLRCLCGWTSARQMPHESTFSRAFQEFAETELPQRLHEALAAGWWATLLVIPLPYKHASASKVHRNTNRSQNGSAAARANASAPFRGAGCPGSAGKGYRRC